MAAADGAALVAAAVRAAVLANAPRRTVAAVAAAVACALVRGPSKAVITQPDAGARARAPQAAGPEVGADSAAALLAALRGARAAQRRRKKERRKAGKAAAVPATMVIEREMPQEPALGGASVPSQPTAPRPSPDMPPPALPLPPSVMRHCSARHASQKTVPASLASSVQLGDDESLFGGHTVRGSSVDQMDAQDAAAAASSAEPPTTRSMFRSASPAAGRHGGRGRTS